MVWVGRNGRTETKIKAYGSVRELGTNVGGGPESAAIYHQWMLREAWMSTKAW
jgi:hypothetical protein